MKRPFIIGIGGTCSNVGKTMTAVLLLQHLSSGTEKWGAIKYTKTGFCTSLVDDKETLSRKDKDTGRFLEAGAGEVVWVKAPQQELADILPLALKRLSSNDGIIVEGNSAIEFLKPDIVIFIFGNGKERWKPGIEILAGTSDIIICEDESELPETAKTKRLFSGGRAGIKEVRVFLELISGLIYERKTERRNNEKGC